MRFAKPITWLLWCGLLMFCASGARAEQTRAPGHIVAVKVQGAVYATNLADQSQVALTEKAIISQQYVVTTGANSSVILLFSNGSTINLGADSTLSIDEFLQDPFADNLAMDQLTEEPTTSVTKITLSRGELVGNVKRIKEEAGSSFTVNTPVGAAGIRGTVFRIVFRPDASGQAFFTLSTAEGRVVYEAPAAAGVPVVTGSEVVVSVDVAVDAATGTVTLTAPPVVAAVQEIPPATQAAIAVAAQQIVEAASTVIISSTQQAADEKAAADKAAADKAAAEKEAAEKAAAEKAAQEKEAQEKAAAEKAAQEKAAQEKAAAEKAAQEKAAQEKAAAEKAAQEQQEQQQQEQQQQEQQQQPSQEQPQQPQPTPTPQPPTNPLPPPTTPPSNTTPGDGL